MTFARTCLATLVLAALPLAAHAGPKYIEVIGKSVEEQCIPTATQITARPDIAAVFGPTPVDAKKVCTCATADFLADPKLHDSLMVDDAVLAPRLKTEPLTSYMSVRMQTAIFKCMAPEMEKSLSSVTLEK